MKRLLATIILLSLLTMPVLGVTVPEEDELNLTAPSAVLMERTTGEILYEKNAHERMSPASVTKVMTLLLIAEQIESGALTKEDMVSASSHAASMGGSQIWLEEGEQMSVHEMLKCIAVSSANDCAVAMAEKIAGSEEAFVKRMNERAQQLGMQDTHFLNCTGLTDDTEHYTTAYDIALMSRELLQYTWLREYTTIWMDTVRDGRFGLTNTNRLVRTYEGATGLKTGFTQQAMYCLSASAERDGAEYIAVVMHAPTSNDRFDDAKALLNYAFANYSVYSLAANVVLPPVRVELGATESLQPVYQGAQTIVVNKGGGEIQCNVSLPESVSAPVEEGALLGKLTISDNTGVLAELPLVAPECVERMSVPKLWLVLLGRL